MTLRSVTGLLLGLLLQIFLALPAGSCPAPESCAPQASVCACCKSSDSCACAKVSGDHEKQPVPDSPSVHTLRVDAAFVPVDVAPQPFAAAAEFCSLLPERSPPARAGFSGVGLSVSLCRLVI